MKSVYAGTADNLNLNFVVEGEFVVPASPVYYTIYDNSGGAISGYTNQSIALSDPLTSTSINITLPSGINTIAGGKVFEYRKVTIKFVHRGVTYYVSDSYYVVNNLITSIQATDVIQYLGIKDGEIFENDVDIVQAYLIARDLLGATDFESAVSSGTIRQLKVNQLIKALAAKEVLTTIELRIYRKAGGDGINFSRFEKIDFAELRGRVDTDINRFSVELSTSVAITSNTISIFSVTTPTDNFPG